MTSKTLLFYDLETSGLSVLDQILSFAAIRVDPETLAEIDVIDLKAQWRVDTLPSMDAYNVHQISIHDHQGEGSELDVIRLIHEQLNQPMTQSGGFNTLGFDDSMLRFAFFRSLLTPYTHQYQGGCGRFDILPLLPFYYLYAPEMLKWPQHPDGRVSFKLEDLNHENGWLEGNAHEALHDVKVTLALARALKVNRPMWEYLMGYYNKDIDRERSQAIGQQKTPYCGVGIMVDMRFGANAAYQVPVLYLGPHHAYKNNLVYLRLDQPLELDDMTFMESRVVRKKVGEPSFVLPYQTKYIDRMPAPMRDQVDANLALIAKTDFGLLRQKLRHQELPVFSDHVDLDAGLYAEGFMSDVETSWCKRFMMGGEGARQELLINPPNRQIYKRSLRLLWRHFPEQIADNFKLDAMNTMRDYLYHGVDQRGNARPSLDDVLLSLEGSEHPEAKKMYAHLQRLKASLVILTQ